MNPEYLILQDRRIAYRRLAGRTPGIMNLGGFFSDMTGTKASFLADRCAEAGFSFLRFDYRGHGQSSGDFRDGCISDWFDDALAVFDRLTTGPQILVGSSMGGWIALLLARARPERIQGIVGIAAAPDFTEDLVWAKLSAEQQDQMRRDGYFAEPSAYSEESLIYTLKLIEDGRRHLVLRQNLELACPLRLLQGQRDDSVPWQTSLRLAEQAGTDDVRVTLVKNGDHRLSRPQDLDLLWQEVEALSAL